MDGDVTPSPLLPLEDNERTNLGDGVGFIDQANLIEQVPDLMVATGSISFHCVC